MLYSNASRSLVDYYLITNDRGQFIYKDERIDQGLFCKIKKEIKDNIIKKINKGLNYHELDILEYKIQIKPMTRPEGHFVISVIFACDIKATLDTFN